MPAEVPLWKRLAGTVVDFEDGAAASPQAAAKPATVAPTTFAPGPAYQPTTQSVDPGLLDTLMKVALGRSTVFSGLVISAERMKSIIPDEQQRIQAAAVNMSSPVTPGALKSAVDGHIQDLAVERGRFAREIEGARASDVNAPAQAAVGFDGQVAAAQAEIDRLTASISDLKARADDARRQAADSEAKITSTVAIFEATAAQVEQRLTSLRDAIISALNK